MSFKELMVPGFLVAVVSASLTGCGPATTNDRIVDHHDLMITDTTQMFYYDHGPSIVPRTTELY